VRLFDTSFIVDLANSDKEAEAVARRMDEEHIFAAISVISVHEYLFGVHYAYFHDKQRLRTKLTSARRDLSRFEILPLTEEIVEISSELHAMLERRGQLIGINDLYIAGTALRYKLVLVTRDVAHYKKMPHLTIETY